MSGVIDDDDASSETKDECIACRHLVEDDDIRCDGYRRMACGRIQGGFCKRA